MSPSTRPASPRPGATPSPETTAEALEPMSLGEELLYFLRYEKRYWLGTTGLIFGLLAAFIVATEGPAMMPFIYTLF